MTLKDYAKREGIALRTAYKYAQLGRILIYEDRAGITRVIPDAGTHHLPKKTRREIIASLREQLDKLILAADENNKVATVKRVENLISIWKVHGITVKGYNAKSVYRKIALAKRQGKLQRKTRSDKFSVRNGVLSESFQKIRELAASVFFTCAHPNLHQTVDLLIERAKREESLYEIAAIPKSTLYKQLSKDFLQSGFRTVHQYMNHHNMWRKNLPTVTGAFTDDVKFMQFVAGDDHKCDVAAVKVYNPLSGKVEDKQVKIWFWNEAKTMYPLGWIIKVGDFTARDLIDSLADVVMQYGLPIGNVLIDNGIGRSEEFRDFWLRLARKEPNYSAAYTPTNKATIERGFGIFKNEFDTFQKNFVSPHKEDSRHTTAALSPEEAELFYEEYKHKLEQYIMGWFIERQRRRVVNGQRKKISIKDFFNQQWLTYVKNEVTPQQVRYAISDMQIRTFRNGLRLGNETYQPSEPLPVSFDGQRFVVLKNPSDPSEVDLYALDDTLDRNSAEMWMKSSYITTLYNVRMNSNKRAEILKLRKKTEKQIKALSITVTEMQQLHADAPMPDTVTPNGELIDARKERIKRNQAALRDSVQNLPAEAVELTKSKKPVDAETDTATGYHLTLEER